MLDKLKNYAKYYENEVRDISNQLRDEMMQSFQENCLTNMRLQEIVCAMRKSTSREESFYQHLVLQV